MPHPPEFASDHESFLKKRERKRGKEMNRIIEKERRRQRQRKTYKEVEKQIQRQRRTQMMYRDGDRDRNKERHLLR